MTLSNLESIVGPINRGQLGDKFKPDYEPLYEHIPAYFSEDRRMAKPPPLTEDLSRLNGKGTERIKSAVKKVWDAMTPEQRRKRSELLARNRNPPNAQARPERKEPND